MPLQNRVDPFGDLHAFRDRGLLMGNRGGRFHDDARKIGARRYVSRRWICCLCDFRERKRDVWGAGYTQLFFLDEVTALAAGHRPCCECRRADARRFVEAFGASDADAMDRVLDAERRVGRMKRLHKTSIDGLPDGAMIARNGAAFAIRGERLLRWSFAGYTDAEPRPYGGEVALLTPPSIVAAFRLGYAPLWRMDAPA